MEKHTRKVGGCVVLFILTIIIIALLSGIIRAKYQHPIKNQNKLLVK